MTRPQSLRAFSIVCAGALAALAIVIAADVTIPGDRRALIELRDAFGSSLDDAMIAVRDGTNTLPLAGAAAVVVIIALWQRRALDALVFAVAFASTMTLNPVLKEVVGRARPDLWPALVHVSHFSFPSGHAANSGALVAGLLLIAPAPYRRIVGAGGGAALAIVALSQLILGVHYPSDIVAGWLWAGACTSAVWSLRAQALPQSNRMRP